MKRASKTHLRNLLGAATCGASRRGRVLLTESVERVSCVRCARLTLEPRVAVEAKALLRTATRLYGTDVILAESEQSLELRAKGKLKYAAFSEQGRALNMLTSSVTDAWRRERARRQRAEPLDPVELAWDILSHVIPERSTNRRMQNQPRPLGALTFSRTIATAVGPAHVSVVVRSDLAVQVHVASSDFVIKGDVGEALDVQWRSEPVLEMPSTARDSIAADVRNALKLFQDGELDAASWTTDARARAILQEWVAVEPPPMLDDDAEEELADLARADRSEWVFP